ncbi:threonine dehydratase [Stella humosa]|uniref:Threonine dehydratase n=1 Tax=Stella humosa TaxID=94 RepID=A0A3N1MAZ1_9PROT|nr:pyridoxal-phosphate dependent enzyme [Stella humosa]ROQ00225.1 threonine dehydratase [Stella humosa]BBK30540.1 serine/threonine dehydratase [Stella humosa]
MSVTIADIERAQARIAGAVRRTPWVEAAPARAALAGRVALKLECLQVTGSFKPRGAINALRSLDPAAAARGLVTASGGNHGLAVAFAGHGAGLPATIFLPETVPAAKVAALKSWGADVRIEGAVWDDSNRAALAHAQSSGQAYLHPFGDPAVMAGQGTLGLEILEQIPDADTLLVAIGGGGLAAGVATAAKARRPGIRIVGIEPTGAPTLYESHRAGRVVTLDRVTTAAGTLAPKATDPRTFAVIERHVDDFILVDDEQMRTAARWLWQEHNVAAELSGAAAVAALMAGAYKPRADERVVAIVCGVGTDGIG